ncbi:MAG: hypothetical protein J6B70_11060 [Oscillospiraceae bacterium]|nr:hypothetical protein [Oscillospiraceae bacterium]
MLISNNSLHFYRYSLCKKSQNLPKTGSQEGLRFLWLPGRRKRARASRPGASLVGKSLRAFPTVFAVCRAHNLFAIGEQIPYIMEQLPLAIVPLDSLRDAPHLQPEMYFLPGTRPGRKCSEFLLLLTQQTLRGF